MQPLVRLHPVFDPQRLEADYHAVRARAVASAAGYPGEGHVGWNSICLHSLGTGTSSLLQAAPYTASLIESLGLNLRLARMLALEPGGEIREHSDAFLSRRIVRLHVPIVSNPDVEMRVGDEVCAWRPGELWYGDFSQPHSGVNRGDTTRIHLVMDVGVDQALLALFPEGPVADALARACAADDTELDYRMLERFEFGFVLPAGFALPGTELESLPVATPGNVRLVDSELCVFVNEQPLLKAVPASEETLDLLGLGTEARLEYTFDGDTVLRVTLFVGPAPVFSLTPQVLSA